MNTPKTPAIDHEAEQMVLAALMKPSPHSEPFRIFMALIEFEGFVRLADKLFYDDRHQAMFIDLMESHSNPEPVNDPLLNLLHSVRLAPSEAPGTVFESMGLNYVLEIAEKSPEVTEDNLMGFIRRVSKAAAKRLGKGL